jgi:outer membrane protein assembly factor BamB
VAAARGAVLGAALAFVAWLVPATGDAALLKTVTSGTVNLPNSAAATQIALTGTDITKAFVICGLRSPDSTPSAALYGCDLNNGGGGGAARLTITPTAAPGGANAFVQYYVAEFTAGVSVQRGTATFSGTSLAPTAAPTLTAVDCTKSFVLTSVRSTDTAQDADERWTVRATLGSAAAPCTSGTTTSLELTRLEGLAGTTVTVNWQVITYEGASVQRGALGTACIGGSGATPSCATAGGATNGLNNRITLGTAVDTSKSFILFTRQAGTATAGIEGEYLVRAEFLSTGTSVTGVQFVRGLTATGNNHHVQISWEVVTLNDGSTVQSSGTSPTSIATGTAGSSPALTTLIDSTRTVAIVSSSGGSAGTTSLLNDVATTGTIVGSNWATQSAITLTRNDTTVTSTNAWFAVSFFRCNTASGLAHDTLCTVGASTAALTATVNWSSVNTVIVLGGTSSVTATPTNGTSYAAGASIGGFLVAYSGSVATDTSFTQSTGLTAGTIYYYKVWAKAGPVGSCTTAPCYIGGAQGTVTPRTGATAWSSLTLGGAALNPAVSGTSRMSLGSNAGKVISLSSASGAWASVPGNTVSAMPGYVSVFPAGGGGDAVIGADQSGWVYSVNPATGAVNWITKLNADTIQASVSTYLRGFFSSAMTAAYPGSYDIIFVATMNNTGSGGFTNNKVFALRADTGATLWTFSPATLSSGLCPSGCGMDQVLGQPWVDYVRDRLYVASRDGSAGTQNSLWFLDVANNGNLVKVFSGADFTTGPSQSSDGTSLWIGDQAGILHIVNLTALTKTTNSVASGTAFKGFVWEDFNVDGRLYFVTTDGNVWCLPTPASVSSCWKTKPVATGTVNQLMPSDSLLWVGGSNGILYQLNLTSGIVAKTFTVGAGTLALGPVSTETGDELYTATSDGTLYKVTLTSGSLP